MNFRKPGWGETWRVLACTLVLALTFIAMESAQTALFRAVLMGGWLSAAGPAGGDPDAELLKEAAKVASDSRAAMRRLPPAHRHAAMRLGYELGYASSYLGISSWSGASPSPMTRMMFEFRVDNAQRLAQALGLPTMQPLPVTNLRAFNELNQRFDRDEDGSAALVQRVLTPQHRHLYSLGLLVGAEAARVDFSRGGAALPPAHLIRRHATLAGIPPTLWQPMARPPATGEPPAAIVTRYLVAFGALENALALP
ncbi:MAG: hypothetical protein ABI699_02610 [Caldimonas sp.]